MAISEEECIEALQRAAEKLGKSPSRPEYVELGMSPSTYTIMNKFGGWNRAKSEAGLEVVEPYGGGLKGIDSKPEHVDLPEGYEWQELTAQQRWYYKNKEHRISVKERRRDELKRWYYELKRDHYECSECSEADPTCLVFHHVGEKNWEISYMVNNGFSRKRILAETENCEVLCANCHHKEHIKNPGSWEADADRGTFPSNQREVLAQLSDKADYRKEEYRASLRAWLFRFKWASGGCRRCPEDNPACLEFHHLNENEKTMSIGSLAQFSPLKDQLLNEINRCEIICRNCHRKEHLSEPRDPLSSQS